MDADAIAARLSDISTQWTVLRQAHSREHDAVLSAQADLIERYQGAIYRYLLGALKDSHAADDVFQEFALRFLRGAFARADGTQGRFRDYLKTTLSRMVVDHHRRSAQFPDQLGEAAAHWPDNAAREDRDFDARWREELLRRTWLALDAYEQESGQPYHAVLRLRSEESHLSSAQLAVRLNEQPGLERSLTETAVRKLLQRSREKFADLLLAEVAASLEDDDLEAIENELIALELLPYCRSALQKRRPST